MSKMLKAALKYESLGLSVHWLRATKNPRLFKAPAGSKDWASAPRKSSEVLERSFVKGAGVGVKPGHQSVLNGEYLYVIDVDIRDDSYEAAAIEALEHFVPSDWRQRFPRVKSGSASKSFHLYFTSSQELRKLTVACSKQKLKFTDPDGKSRYRNAWEIDVCGNGKQVVMPPTIHRETGERYRWEQEFNYNALRLGLNPSMPDKTVSSWVKYERDIKEGVADQLPLGLSIEEATELVMSLPTSWSDDRDTWLSVGMALSHEFGRDGAGYEIWEEFSRRSIKFDDEDQDVIWKSFKNKGRVTTMASIKHYVSQVLTIEGFAQMARDMDELGIEEVDDDPTAPSNIVNRKGSPATHWGETDKLEVETSNVTGTQNRDSNAVKPNNTAKKKKRKKKETSDAPTLPSFMQKLNDKHAIVDLNGKTRVINKDSPKIAFQTVADFHLFYANYLLPGAGEKMVAASTLWMKHPSRETYKGVDFRPNNVGLRDNYLNMWRGWGVEPVEGDTSLFTDHLREVICSGNQDHYEYLMGWLAHMFQCPERKPGVALVLRSAEGTGKDTMGVVLKSLLGELCTNITDPKHGLGQYNSLTTNKLLINIQELAWAGDKKNAGLLKALITSEEMSVEPKGVDPYPISSCCRVMMSSNEDWVIPASKEARRFFVLDVSDSKRGDVEYFDRLYTWIKSANAPAEVLNLLLNWDLSNFNVLKFPRTKALNDQKLLSLTGVDAYLKHLVDAGPEGITTCDFYCAGDIKESGVSELELLDGYMLNRARMQKKSVYVTPKELFNDYQKFVRESGYYSKAGTYTSFRKELLENRDKVFTMCKRRLDFGRPWVVRISSWKKFRELVDKIHDQ